MLAGSLPPDRSDALSTRWGTRVHHADHGGLVGANARAAALDVAAPTDPCGTDRPARRFETEDELRILLDAALVVMERNGYADAAVADILRRGGSVDPLVLPPLRVEGSAAAARSSAARPTRRQPPPRQGRCGRSPREALHAWIDEILSFGHDRAKAARIRVLGSPGAMKAEGYVDEMRQRSAALGRSAARPCCAPGPPTAPSPGADPRGGRRR